MQIRNPVDSQRRLDLAWRPKPGVTYYMHADLAQKHDRAAIACAHVDGWLNKGMIMGNEYIVPNVVVDFVVWWEPSKGMPIKLQEVGQWIIDLKQRGVDIGLVSTDRWNNLDFQTSLKSVGFKVDTVSVGKVEYDNMALMVADQRVMMPSVKILKRELMQLRVINDRKVDHPRSGSKDLSDAVAGAVHNAVAHTPRTKDQVIETRTYREREKVVAKHRQDIPADIKEWLVSRL